MTAIRNFGLLTLVKQDVAGTAETDATGGYSMPIVSGMIRPSKEWDDLPRAGNSMIRQGRFPTRATVGGTVTVLATPNSLGFLLYNAMGTELALGTPANGVTPHTFTMADNWPSQLTAWASLGSGSDADVWRFKDAQITRLQIQAASGGNALVELELVAKHYTKTAAGASGWPANYNAAAVLDDAEPRFKFIGSQVGLDSDGATVTMTNNVESITLEINRDPEIRYGTTLTPSTFAPDRMVNFSAELVYDSAQHGWDFIEDAYLAALAGNPDQSTPTGAFDVTLGVHPSGSFESFRVVSGGGATLPTTVTVERNWEFGVDRPDASGDPSLTSYTLDGVLRDPALGPSEIAVVVKNTVATLYSAA